MSRTMPTRSVRPSMRAKTSATKLPPTFSLQSHATSTRISGFWKRISNPDYDAAETLEQGAGSDLAALSVYPTCSFVQLNFTKPAVTCVQYGATVPRRLESNPVSPTPIPGFTYGFARERFERVAPCRDRALHENVEARIEIQLTQLRNHYCILCDLSFSNVGAVSHASSDRAGKRESRRLHSWVDSGHSIRRKL